MKILKILLISLFLGSSIYATTVTKSEKVIYKYKKYEKFDFETIDVDAGLGNKGELSVFSRYIKKFKNKLPYRTNFRREIWRAVERSR